MVVGVIIGKLLPAIPNALGNLEISGKKWTQVVEILPASI